MATDDELVQQIRKGKSEAYGQLFSRYHQQIYSIYEVLLLQEL